MTRANAGSGKLQRMRGQKNEAVFKKRGGTGRPASKAPCRKRGTVARDTVARQAEVPILDRLLSSEQVLTG